MIMDPTVLILGAGASKPFGYPLGRELLLTIKKELSYPESHPLKKALIGLGINEKHIYDFRSELTYADPPSVDAFLEDRRDYIDIGKLAMAICLIRCEKDLTLFNIHCEPAQHDSWYRYLMDKMHALDLDEFKHNKLSIITFNYDRSLEHYLFTTLKHRLNISDDNCASTLSCLRIIHIHGRLGALPWQTSGGREYGPNPKPEETRMAAQEIKIVSEKDENANVFNDAFNMMTQAEKIYFLGFGYYDTNLRRLGMARLVGKKNVTYGTSIGIGKAIMKSIGETWRITFPEKNIDIIRLFDDYAPL